MRPLPGIGFLTTTVLCAAACGGGGSPTGPTEEPLYTVVAHVFYDENGNGLKDPSETAVVPNAEVEVAGLTGISDSGTGRVAIEGVPGGTMAISIRRLPPFYAAGSATMVTVPQPDAEHLFLPATLPIDGNIPSSYMAYGDSITDGCGSTDMTGYRTTLENDLRSHFNRATIVNRSFPGTRSMFGANQIGASLGAVRPSYALILYGTNDWNDHDCRSNFPCYTIDSLRTMVHYTEAAHSLPFLATIIPANTGFDQRAPPERNVWVAQMNDLIRPMAAQEGAVLVDLYAAFMAQPNFKLLMSDHVHPNDMGYAIMASEWFKAITQSSDMTQPMSLDLGLIPRVDPVHPPAAAPPHHTPPRSLGPYRRT